MRLWQARATAPRGTPEPDHVRGAVHPIHHREQKNRPDPGLRRPGPRGKTRDERHGSEAMRSHPCIHAFARVRSHLKRELQSAGAIPIAAHQVQRSLGA